MGGLVGLAAPACANTEARPLPFPAHVPVVASASAAPREEAPDGEHAATDALLRRTVAEWGAAHDAHDRKRLEALYDGTIRLGHAGGIRITRDGLLRLKEAGFARAPAARHTQADLHIERGTPGLPAVRFRRAVSATNRVQSTEVRLTFSCDRALCLVVEEAELSAGVGAARAAALATRPGSCTEALVLRLASVPDVRAGLGGRPASAALLPIAAPPESPRFVFVLLRAATDTGATSQPWASGIYEIGAGDLEITEALPGDLTHAGDSAAREHAKRACTSR